MTVLRRFAFVTPLLLALVLSSEAMAQAGPAWDARKAGFENADAIGPYMRTLIASHHDTLGTLVR